MGRMLAASTGAAAWSPDDVFRKYDSTDWEAFWDAAAHHGTAPLLYHFLSQHHALAHIPVSRRKSVREQYYSSLARNTFFLSELARVIPAFHHRGIEPLFLKGIAFLVSGLYEHPGVRPLTDIDLLVRESDIPSALEILASLGYRYEPFSHFPPGFLPPPQYLHRLSDPGTESLPAYIDLHSRLSAHGRFGPAAYDDLWTRSETCSFEHLRCRIPAPEDTLLVSAMHLATHRFRYQLIWLLDIYELIRQKTLDWPILISRAREWKCRYPLLFSLHITSDQFPLDLPEFPPLTGIRETAFRHLFRDRVLLPPEKMYRGRIRQLCTDLITQDSLSRFLKFLIRYIRFRVARWRHPA